MTWQKAVIFNSRFFDIDPFSYECRDTSMLTSSNLKMTFSFAIVSNIAITALINPITVLHYTYLQIKKWRMEKEMEFLRLKKLLNRFLDWKTTFILQYDNVLLTDLHKHVLKFAEYFPKNGRAINNSFLCTVVTVCLGMYSLSKKFLIHWSIVLTR